MSTTPAYVTLTGPQPGLIVATGTIPASAAAGTVVSATLQYSPQVPASSSITIPITEVWSVVDIYTLSTYSPDFYIQLLINGYLQNINPTANSVYVNNYSRWKLTQAIKLAPASNFSVQFVTLSAAGSSAVSVTVYFAIVRAPFVAQTTSGGS